MPSQITDNKIAHLFQSTLHLKDMYSFLKDASFYLPVKDLPFWRKENQKINY